MAPRDARHRFDQFERARLVGLQRQPETLPVRMVLCHLRSERFENVEGDLQAVDFLGVDRQVDVGACRLRGQLPHAGHELAQHALALQGLVARVQGRQLDRDAVVALDGAVDAGARRNRLDGVRVAREVALRVVFGARAFAEHVEGKAQVRQVAARIVRGIHRFDDVLAQHELAAEQLHGAQGRRDDGARAKAAEDARVLLLRQHFLGHRDRGLRQARQCAVRCAFEVGAAQLVRGKRDRRLGIGHAQKRFGQSHQRKPFGARDRVLLEQAFHRPEGRRVLAHGGHPRLRVRGGGRPVQRGFERSEAVAHHLGLGAVRVGQALDVRRRGVGHGVTKRRLGISASSRFLW